MCLRRHLQRLWHIVQPEGRHQRRRADQRHAVDDPGSGCGATANITVTKSNANDSFEGWLFNTKTDKWGHCSGNFVKFTGKTITLCTGVKATTLFAVVQDGNTRRNISVGF